MEWIAITYCITLTACPALSLPSGFTGDGLPVGMQLIAANVTAYEFFTGCQQAGLSVGIIYSPEEAFEDEHFKARGFQVELVHDDLGRTVKYPGAPYKLPASPWSIYRRAPHLGEHTDEVLQSLK
ncbi:MAG: hypothetical protein CMK60_14685 [Proteobacteria bacterium]|nr:hypothetical protein [Pseudomonadota bacterium]